MIYTFVLLVFVQNAFLCFSSKTGSEVVSREARDLELPTKCAWGKFKSHIFIQRVSLLPCKYFSTKFFLQNVFRQKLKFFSSSYRGYRNSLAPVLWLRASHESFSMSRDFLVTASLLSNPRKTRVFSFLCSRCDRFSNTLISLAKPLFEPFSTQNYFYSNPIIFKHKPLQNHFKVCFSKHFFLFSFNCADFSLGF